MYISILITDFRKLSGNGISRTTTYYENKKTAQK